MDYGKALTIVRASKGLNQKDFAELIGKTPSYVSRVESNDRKLSLDMVDTICDKLGIPVALFMLLRKKNKDMNEYDQRLVDELGSELLRVITEG